MIFSFSTNNAINVLEYTIILSSFLPFISFLLSIYQCAIICDFYVEYVSGKCFVNVSYMMG